MDLQILSDKPGYYWGSHTGYEQIIPHLTDLNPTTRVYITKTTLPYRIVGKTYSIYRGWWGRRDSPRAASELRFYIASRKNKAGVNHILYFGWHHFFTEHLEKAPKNLVGTIHESPSRWPPGMMSDVKRLSSMIVFYKRDIKLFEELIGVGHVKFIRHGVDTEFFQPPQKPPEPESMLFVGWHDRNIKMLERVIPRLIKNHPTLRFDFLVPELLRAKKEFDGLRGRPSIRWVGGLSDEQLRGLYQNSYLLLMPMDNCAAKNAIVEALACGLPPVLTNVGGVPDYGGGTLYPTVENNDDDGMVEIIESYLSDPSLRSKISQKCREFAEQNLAWPLIARQHMQAYGQFLD